MEKHNIHITFEPGAKTAEIKEDVWQYDYGQVLQISGLSLPPVVEVHYANKGKDIALPQTGVTEGGITTALIPNEILEEKGAFTAYIFVTDGESGETCYTINGYVNKRPPVEGFNAPEDQEILHAAVGAVNAAAERAESAETKATEAASQASEDVAQTSKDREAVKNMVDSVEGIDEQVKKVEECTRQSQEAATQAGEAKEEAVSAKSDAEKAAQKTAEDKTAVELAKTAVDNAQQAVRTDRTAVESVKQSVEQLGNAIPEATQTGVQAVDQAKQTAVNEINQTGNTHKTAVEAAGTKAVENVENVKQTATKAIQTEGTTQTANVTTEGAKQLTAVREAAQEIIGDREQIKTNKTDITALKENLKELTPRVDNLEKKTAKYSERFFENFFAMQRTGKKYTVRFPLWETSQVATGEKLDDNEGFVMEASTLTEKGRDDYSAIPLFKTYDCNVVQVNGKPKISAMRGDKEFDSKEKDTFVLGMSYYHKFWIQDGYMYYSRSDSPREGYVICAEAKKKNGERPFCLYAKYVSGINSKGELGSFYGKNPTRNKISFNSSLSEAKKRGTGYIFGCSADYAYIQNTFMLKYADRNWNTVLGGNFASSGNQFLVSKPEADTKRVVITKANAEKFPIGSCVSVGDLGQDTNKDRGNAKIHNICDSAKILDIIEVDEANKALVLDINENITTTATTWVTAMHWKSGFSDSVKGIDGCPCNTKTQISSLLYPTVFQGIELAVGGYEVLGNAFMDISADSLVRDTYVCDDSEKLVNNVTTAKTNWKKLLQQLHVEKNNAWCYGTELHMDLESGINVVTKAGSSGSGSNTGFCDGIYFDTGTNTQREFLLLGVLGNGGVSGAFCSGGNWLGNAWWNFLARLSLSIYRGEFA